MTPDDGLDRPLSAWLEQEAAMRAPTDLLAQVMDRAADTRRRPSWATTGRWVSMETRAQLGAVPRSAIILATLALLAALAAGTIAYSAGGADTSGLPPTGPAGNGLIAFADGGDIWVVNPDGTEPRRSTSGPAEDGSAAWSRDGKRLAYWSIDPSGSPSSLDIVAADGSDRVSVFTDDAGRTPQSIDWSPDGSRIAFALCPERSCGDFHVVATDGSGSDMIGGPTFQAHVLAWSPDGSTIAFGGRAPTEPGSSVASRRGVYLMDPRGTDVRLISTGVGLDGFDSVAWSADGASLIAHAGTHETGSDIWVISADGSGDVNLTDGPAAGFLPAWSPDDAWVAYRDAEAVFLVPGAGGDSRQIGYGEGYTWSPDATMLALSGTGGLTRTIDVLTGDTVMELPAVPGIDAWQRVAP